MNNRSRKGATGLSVLVSSRWKDRERMLGAAKKQQQIKKKYGAPAKGWSSLAELGLQVIVLDASIRPFTEVAE